MQQTTLIIIALPVIVAAIAWIDLRTLTIPNALTAVLAILGIAFQLRVAPQGVWVHVESAALVLVGLWLLRLVHARICGRIGLGLGDVKMAGACALWLEPSLLPIFIFLASGSALLYVASFQWRGAPIDMEVRHPFGPFLGVGLLATFALSHLGPMGLDIGQ